MRDYFELAKTLARAEGERVMAKRYFCFNCGAEVTSEDYDYVAYVKQFVCSKNECLHELLNEQL